MACTYLLYIKILGGYSFPFWLKTLKKNVDALPITFDAGGKILSSIMIADRNSIVSDYTTGLQWNFHLNNSSGWRVYIHSYILANAFRLFEQDIILNKTVSSTKSDWRCPCGYERNTTDFQVEVEAFVSMFVYCHNVKNIETTTKSINFEISFFQSIISLTNII